jgi:hypothetical protein
MMTSSSDFRSDHEWFADEFSHYWVNGFCLTFIAGKPAELVKVALVSSVGAMLMDVAKPTSYSSRFVRRRERLDHARTWWVCGIYRPGRRHAGT